MAIKDLVKKIKPVLKKHGAKKAALFGSYVNGLPKKDSDLDILVDLPRDKKGLDFVGFYTEIKEELEEKLNKKVDLVQYSLVKESLKPYIYSKTVSIPLD
jgi:hypothetical protein